MAKYIGFFAILIITGCTFSTNDELTINAVDDVKMVFVDSFSIHTSTVSIQPVLTQNSSRLLFGSYSDPEIGLVAAKGFSQLTVSSSSFPSDSSVYDSMLIYLDINYTYGDITKPQTISIYELNETLINKTFNNTDETGIKPTRLNEQITFLPAPLDSPFITLKMSDAFGERIFQHMRSIPSDFTIQEKLNAYFKGISIIGGSENSSILGISTSSGLSKVNVYYHQEGQEVPYTSQLLIGNSVIHYHHLEREIPDPLISKLTDKTEVNTLLTADIGYTYSDAGIFTKLTFPYLPILKDSMGYVTVNKAELVIENIEDYNSFSPPPLAFNLIEINTANEIRYYVDEDENPTADDNTVRDSLVKAVQQNNPAYTYTYGNNLTFAYNKDFNNYSAEITNYIEALINGSKSSQGLILYPTDAGISVNRLLLGGQNAPGKAIKLKVYYSTQKQ